MKSFIAPLSIPKKEAIKSGIALMPRSGRGSSEAKLYYCNLGSPCNEQVPLNAIDNWNEKDMSLKGVVKILKKKLHNLNMIQEEV